MADIKFDIVNDDITPFVRKLSSKDWFNIEKRAMRKGVNKLKNDARRRLRSSLPAVRKQNPKYSDKMTDAIMGKTFVSGKNVKGQVHNAGTRKKTSGTYRARFYEQGSTRKKRGSIPGFHYMKNTEAKLDDAMQKVTDQLDVEFEKMIRKKGYDG